MRSDSTRDCAVRREISSAWSISSRSSQPDATRDTRPTCTKRCSAALASALRKAASDSAPKRPHKSISQAGSASPALYSVALWLSNTVPADGPR